MPKMHTSIRGTKSCIAEGAEGGKFEFGVVQTLTGRHTLDVWIAEDSGVAPSATSAQRLGITIRHHELS
jgi:hypothetical protein